MKKSENLIKSIGQETITDIALAGPKAKVIIIVVVVVVVVVVIF